MPRMKRKRSATDRNLVLRGATWWVCVRAEGRRFRKSTGCPKGEIAAARRVRDAELARLAQKRSGILEELPDPPSVDRLLDLYLKAESREYDRENLAEQPGSKRSWKTDRATAAKIRSSLDPTLRADRLTAEDLRDVAGKLEESTLAPDSRRKCFALLRRAYNWGRENKRKTGIASSPFEETSCADRRRMFPRGERGYIFNPGQLRQIYDAISADALPFVRFAVHTGMRLNEIITLRWRSLNLEQGTVTVEERYAKAKKARDLALGDVALSVLRSQAERGADPDSPAFRRDDGRPVSASTIEHTFTRAVEAVWKPSKPGEKRPRFHDLRKTAATRVESCSSYAVARAFLGHAALDVTGLYVRPQLDAVRDAVNRAANLIDGPEVTGNVVDFRQEATPKTTATERQAI